jgi:hypothetical protein
MPYDKISLCFGPSTWCTYMLRMFYNGFSWVFMCFCMCLRHMFQIFHLLQMYVANILWGCFKNRSGDAHVSLTPVAGGQRPAIGPRLLLSFPSHFPLPSISPRHWRWSASRRVCCVRMQVMAWDGMHGAWDRMRCGCKGTWDAMWT